MADPRGVRAGRAFVELGLDRNAFVSGLRSSAASLKSFGSRVRNIGLAVTGIGTAVAAPFAISARAFSNFGDAIAKAARRTGLSTEAVSEFGFAAEQSGSDVQTFEKAVRTMQRSVNDLGRNLSTQVDAFSDLGLTINDLQGLSPEKQFELLASRLASVEDPSKRAAVAMMIFGRAGTALLPLIEGGVEGMNALRQEARDLGLVFDRETSEAAERLNDAFGRLSRVTKAVIMNVGRGLAGPLENAATLIARVGSGVSNWVAENGALIKSVGLMTGVVIGLGGTILALGVSIQLVGFALGGFAAIASIATGATGGLLAVVTGLATPFGALAAAVVASAAVVESRTGVMAGGIGRMAEAFMSAKDTATSAIGGIVDALRAGDLELAARIASLGVQLAFAQGVLPIRELWTDVTFGMLEAFERFKTGTIDIADALWQNVVLIWKRGLNTLVGAWRGFESLMRPITDKFFAGLMLRIQAAFDDTIDLEDAFKRLDDQIQRDRQSRDQAAGQEAAQSRAELEKETAERAQALKARIEARRKERDEEIAAIRGASGDAVTALDAEIESLAIQLAKLLDRSSEAAAAAAEGVSEGIQTPGETDSFGTPEKRATAALGTFNPERIGESLAGGIVGTLEAKQQQANELLQEIADNTEPDGQANGMAGAVVAARDAVDAVAEAGRGSGGSIVKAAQAVADAGRGLASAVVPDAFRRALADLGIEELTDKQDRANELLEGIEENTRNAGLRFT